jgi:hypothetical protein
MRKNPSEEGCKMLVVPAGVDILKGNAVHNQGGYLARSFNPASRWSDRI